MSISPEQIGWSHYLEYEGAFWRGSQKYQTPDDPDWDSKVLSVITATEGGTFDAYNGYDRCISTSGLVQWCEANQYSVSDMLGVVADRGLSALDELGPALEASRAEFKKNNRGRWRFFFVDQRADDGEVDRLREQQQLFLLTSDGRRGTWNSESTHHAKIWAAAISSVWTHEDAQQAQMDYTVPKLMDFVTAPAKAILFGPNTPSDNEGWVGAVRAGYLSFAANLPAVASTHLQRAVQASKNEPFSEGWCVSILKQLTFGPQIAIYPKRYNAIRPVLERLFEVNIPDFATDLQVWKEKVLVPASTTVEFDDLADYQRELIAEGYDLGPAGADGILGRLTKAAIVQFQQLHKLTPDGIIGPKTRAAFVTEASRRK